MAALDDEQASLTHPLQQKTPDAKPGLSPRRTPVSTTVTHPTWPGRPTQLYWHGNMSVALQRSCRGSEFHDFLLINVRLVFDLSYFANPCKMRAWNTMIPAILHARVVRRAIRSFGCGPSRVAFTGCSNAGSATNRWRQPRTTTFSNIFS